MLKEKKFTINPDLQAISGVVRDVQEELKLRKVTSTNTIEACVTLEDTLVKYLELTDSNNKIKVSVNSSLRKTWIKVVARGKKTEIADLLPDSRNEFIIEEYGPEAENSIREMVLSAFAERIRYKHSKGVNTISILAQKSKNSDIYDTLTALVAAIVIGGLCRIVLPESICAQINEYVFTPLYTLFLNAIRMIMAPLVFFSLAACVTGFSDLRALGRTGAKVVSGYFLTTFVSVAISFGLVTLFDPQPISLPSIGAALEPQPEVKVSLLDTLVNIVPSNMAEAFLKADMMQIIFMSILTGIAAGAMGKKSEQIISFISMLDALFNNITGYIIRFLPVAIFASFSTMMITISVSKIQAVALWAIIVVLAVVMMFVLYILLLAVVARTNPFVFFVKYARVMIIALSTCSSNATIPTAMDCCGRLGISPRIYSFSIPLGATISMNGTSIMYATLTLFLAAITGTQIDPGIMVSLVATIVMLAMASPGVPGAATACETLLLSMAGVPLEVFGLVLGIMPLIEPLLTMTNVVSDGVVSTIVARSEGLLDTEQYSS